jgi:hypothetical protein
VINSGAVLATGDLAISAPSITADAGQRGGLFEMGAQATLALDAGKVSSDESVDFTGRSGALTIGSITGFDATIQNFGAGDQIRQAGFDFRCRRLRFTSWRSRWCPSQAVCGSRFAFALYTGLVPFP